MNQVRHEDNANNKDHKRNAIKHESTPKCITNIYYRDEHMSMDKAQIKSSYKLQTQSKHDTKLQNSMAMKATGIKYDNAN